MWTNIVIISGFILALVGVVVGLFYLFKKYKKGQEILSAVVGMLPFLEGFLRKFGVGEKAHDILNTIKHLSKTSAFLLDYSDDMTFEQAKPFMKDYVLSCKDLFGLDNVTEGLIDAELITAFKFMQETLKNG